MEPSESQSAARSVAVIGTGSMGSAFVRPLLQQGHRVVVWNRTASRCAPLVAQGATTAATFEDAVAAAETILVSVWQTTDLTELIRGLPPRAGLDGRCVVNTSTGSPEESRTAAGAVAELGGSFLAASIINFPMHIGTENALIHYGGDPLSWEQHRETLEPLAPTGSIYLGDDVSMPAIMDVACAGTTMGMGMAAFLEGAAYAASQGIPVERVKESVTRLLPMLQLEIAAMTEQIEAGSYETDQSTVDNWRHGMGEFRDAVQSAGQPAFLLDGLVRSLDHARASGRSTQALTALFPAVRDTGAGR